MPSIIHFHVYLMAEMPKNGGHAKVRSTLIKYVLCKSPSYCYFVYLLPLVFVVVFCFVFFVFFVFLLRLFFLVALNK